MQNIKDRFDASKKVLFAITKLREETVGMLEPMSFLIAAQFGRDPLLILVSCILSSRTRDPITYQASLRLFEHAQTAQELLDLPLQKIESSIYPVGFYRQKSSALKKLASQLLEQFSGKVPDTFEQLVLLSGVGPKTANLVLGVGFGIPALCVDIHVHRIANRLGIVTTSSPVETERELKKIIPKDYWIEFNRLLVMWGQNVCVPVSPKCSVCAIASVCSRKGVLKNR